MTRKIDNGSVAVTLENGTWSADWAAAGVTAGPFEAHVELGDRTLDTRGFGAWAIDAGDAFGRAGAWARWIPTRDGPMIAIHLPSEGPILVVEVSYRARTDQRFDRIVPIAGTVGIDAIRRLVNGYDSWAWSGVRSGEGKAQAFWNAALVGDDDRTFAVQALSAERLCTRIESHGPALRVECGATPPLRALEGTWGYEVGAPTALGVPLPAAGEERSAPIALLAGNDPLGVTDELAALAGRESGARRWSGPPATGWQSWYHFGLLDIDPHSLLANGRLLRQRYRGRPGFDLVQLDDGWQVTYGEWTPNARFPDNLEKLVRDLAALDCRAGLWLAPFMVQPGAPGVGTEHPDWCVHGPDGKPLVDRLGRWALDASNPVVLAWLRDLGARVHTWGFEMVKLDFLYLGAIEGARHDARVTGVEALRRGLRAFVDGLGPDAYVLGCGMPLLPAAGICHGNRVGHDLAMPVLMRELGQPREQWHAIDGIRPQARNVAARFAMRHWFQCDPDVVMAWGSEGDDPAGFAIEESRALATLVALCGGPFFLADNLAALADDARAVVEHPGLLDLIGKAGFRPLDLFAHVDAPAVEHFFADAAAIPSIWQADRNGRQVIALFNWTDEPATRSVPHAFVGAAELWTGESVDTASIEIPPHGVRVLVG